MTNTKLKPFDLEAAKRGEKVVRPDGRSVRIICFDASLRGKSDFPIIALVTRYDSAEYISSYDEYGENPEYHKDSFLHMAPETITLHGHELTEDDEVWYNGSGHCPSSLNRWKKVKLSEVLPSARCSHFDRLNGKQKGRTVPTLLPFYSVEQPFKEEIVRVPL